MKKKTKCKSVSSYSAIFECDQVTRTKRANEIVLRLSKKIDHMWRELIAEGWAQWEVQILIEHACDRSRCWFNLNEFYSSQEKTVAKPLQKKSVIKYSALALEYKNKGIKPYLAKLQAKLLSQESQPEQEREFKTKIKK